MLPPAKGTVLTTLVDKSGGDPATSDGWTDYGRVQICLGMKYHPACYCDFRMIENLKNAEIEKTSLDNPKSPIGGSHPTRSAAARWGGKESLFADGYLSVPNKFLRTYALLKPPLTSGEALFVLQLMTFKWDKALPFPAYKKISDAMGVTDKMARRYAQGLERKGYLRRRFQDRATNRFDLTGLFEALLVGHARLPTTETAPETDDVIGGADPDYSVYLKD